MSPGTLEVLDPGPLTTVQDQGRPGFAHLGVPRSGALDVAAADLANRLLGNRAHDALLEVSLGGCRVRFDRGTWVAVTGAPAPLTCAGRALGFGRAEWVPPGQVLTLGTSAVGMRSYLAVAGGIAVPEVLGSRSTDLLAGVGPTPLRAGAVLPLGMPHRPPPALDLPGDLLRPTGPATVHVVPGPQADWFADPGQLCRQVWQVQGDSNRVGLRLAGAPALRRTPAAEGREMVSEPMVLGAVQIPPSGHPVVFLADHPTTGGYPVVAVVVAGLGDVAQARPGDPVHVLPR